MDAKKLGDKLHIDWDKIPLKEFRMGLEVEKEHRDVTKGDPIKTAKIAIAHIKEDKQYYKKLKKYVEKPRGSR